MIRTAVSAAELATRIRSRYQNYNPSQPLNDVVVEPLADDMGGPNWNAHPVPDTLSFQDRRYFAFARADVGRSYDLRTD